MNDAQKARIENNGVLLAAGLIAGEALVGLFLASLAIFRQREYAEAERQRRHHNRAETPKE